MSSGLQVNGLCKNFGSRVVLEHASFEARCGEFVVILGPSGAGKTTLFRCIAGLVPYDEGAITLNGMDMANLHGHERWHVGVIFQQFNLVRRLTALENVLAGRLGFVPAWRGWLRKFSRADVLSGLEYLDRVGLLDHAHQRADTLSGGQQQRVAIARILAQQPALILADEPVSSLDPQTSVDIIEILRAICHTTHCVVVCSLHQAHLAQEHADRIIGLVGGQMDLNISPQQFDDAAFARLYGNIHLQAQR